MPAKLGYWKIRGLAQPIRLLLAYTGTDYEDVQYEAGGPPDYDRSCWFSVKETLGLPFPNLPYYIDGDIKITQSNAILRYIGEKNKLAGTTEQDRATVLTLENELMDFRNGFVRLCYNQGFNQELRDNYIKDVKGGKLKRFSAFLADREWNAAGGITFVDFVMYELLDQHVTFEPTILDEFPNLKAFLKRFEALPVIKSYMESPKFMKSPINNPTAKWK
ncbi:glutathione S-transferase Mu 3-like [Dysidea avara]|uniref:glutathione S-transferase Mu 3-like n=1 Tax=Dysidea avara TaxID=196820 RepID=UPI00332F3F1C